MSRAFSVGSSARKCRLTIHRAALIRAHASDHRLGYKQISYEKLNKMKFNSSFMGECLRGKGITHTAQYQCELPIRITQEELFMTPTQASSQGVLMSCSGARLNSAVFKGSQAEGKVQPARNTVTLRC